ncbi:lycopene cyclase domain-containing protein [Mycolicibacterium komossense]|uniref:Lycopene cyclase domain-containing protein n=1 Tax=Mycolicibacterium komossense TaxID=1779 RepID=A0ABT3CIX7_9MYCO|nr:lycopene cyclase domain-containing protein [Mycolicibacterium komossense]MCV7229402.1 lycopene cyclase domain-containing protein [Mycolicibacterium komossense]
MSEHWQYLLVLGACLVITAPLEFFGAGVYRQPWRAIRAVAPVALVFIVWDAIAIAAHIWTYNPQFVIGIDLLGRIPLEELLFFVVIPLCGLLTYNAVNAMLGRLRRLRVPADHHAGQR